jgi:ribosomal protein S12 methylthiotransferase accessory factor
VGLPNWYCIRPGAICPTAIVNAGKGPTREQAILSALYETFERWASEKGEFLSFVASTEALRSLFPDVSAAVASGHRHEKELAWCLGYDLVSLTPCFVPVSRVLFPYYSGVRESSASLSHTNGLASGTNPIETICSALFELIERDSLSRMSLEELDYMAPADLPAEIEALFEPFIRNGVDLALYRVPSPTTIPVFYCLSRDDQLAVSHFFCYGSGAHSDPTLAAARAITEVSQSRVAFITTLRDDVAADAEWFAQTSYGKRRRELAAWFSPETTHKFPEATVSNGTYRQLLRYLIEDLCTAFPNPQAVAVMLRSWEGIYAFRVYCPQLFSYDIGERLD